MGKDGDARNVNKFKKSQGKEETREKNSMRNIMGKEGGPSNIWQYTT